eukprot:7105582-Ditylum_brightwellii.AAC.1
MFIYHEDSTVMNFSQRQQEYEEEQYLSSLKIYSAYAELKGDFCALCKLIDGDQDKLNAWKKSEWKE